MKLYNYLEALTPQQQRKWQEKKGALCYYEWFDRLYDSVDLECAGAIMLAILHYDRTGGAKPIPAKLMKVIKRDKAALVLLETFTERTAAASREWINRHKLKNTAYGNQEEKSSAKDDDDTPPFDEVPF